MDDLKCPKCSGVFRERGEVRVHFGRCGCSIAPDSVVHFAQISIFTMKCIGGLERRWCAGGMNVSAEHPTRDGAIAAWREALAKRQRVEDEKAAHPLIVVSVDEEDAEPTQGDVVTEYALHTAICKTVFYSCMRSQ